MVPAAPASAQPAAGDPEPPEPERIAPGPKTPAVPATMPEPYAVMTFQNRSGANGWDWMNAAVPFVLGEKLELHGSKLRPAYQTGVVSGMPPHRIDARSVEAFAEESGAVWIWAGWVDRLDNWDLQLGVELWRVKNGSVRKIGEVVGRDGFKHVHKLTGEAIEELCEKAGMPLDFEARQAAHRYPTEDHYAFTLFGRGLAFFTGTLGWVDLVRAQKNLQRATYIDPTLAEGHRVLGELFLRIGKPGLARLRFDKALAHREDYYAALSAQAQGEYVRGNLERVRDMHVEMIHQRPWDLERRYQLGKVLWELGEVDRALFELDRVVAMKPDDVRARRILVLVHATKGELGDLVGELERVTSLDPEDLPTKLDLAAAYAAAGRDARALETYGKVIGIQPDHPLAHKFAGDLYARNGNTKLAIRAYRHAIEANPRDARPYFRLGALYVENGKDRRARRIYLRAQRFKSYLGQTWSNLGAIAYREGKRYEALWYLQRAVKKAPDDVSVRYNLALVLSALDEPTKALEQIQAGLALDPYHADLHYLRGVALLRRGDPKGARKAFNHTLALSPAHADAQHNLAHMNRTERRVETGALEPGNDRTGNREPGMVR